MRTRPLKGSTALVAAVAMVLSVLAVPRATPARADFGDPHYYAQPLFNLDPGTTVGPRAIYAASDDQRAALAALETSATADVAADHGLSVSDSATMLAWARNDIRARIYADLLAIVEMPANERTADEQQDYQWVQAVVQRQAITAALDAIGEYNEWSGGTSYDQQQVANPNPPVNYGADGTSGYCRYHAPDEAEGDDSYQGRDDPTCSVACQSPQGCEPPTPSYDTFLGWGNYDEDSTLLANPNVPTAVPTSADAVAGTIAEVAFGVGALGGAASVPVGTALAGSAVQEAILPYAVKSFLGAGEALAAGLAFIVLVVVVAFIVATLRGLRVIDDAQLPDKLDQLLAGAQADTNPDLADIFSVDYGKQVLLAFVTGATTPDPDPAFCDPAFYDCSAPQPLPPSDSDQEFDVKAYGQSFGSITTTVDSQDWGNSPQTTRVTAGWFVTAGTDPTSGASVTVQGLAWRYVDWNGKHWTARLVQDASGARHFVATMAASDWPTGGDGSSCQAIGTCFTGDSIEVTGPTGALDTVRLLGLPPTAQLDEYAYDPDQLPLSVPAPGVLANDTDPQGETLIAFLADAPSHGSVDLLADGSFTYTPDGGYVGRDTFTYTAVNTDRERSAPVTVYLDSGYPPVAVDDSYVTAVNTTMAVPAPGVEANDSDPDGSGLSRAPRPNRATGRWRGRFMATGFRSSGCMATGISPISPTRTTPARIRSRTPIQMGPGASAMSRRSISTWAHRLRRPSCRK